FALWARVALGRNWSGVVTLKEGHELIEHGPYRFVRHPIYTGIFTMFFATALALGHLSGFAGALLTFASFWVKLCDEEKLMLQQFPERYAAYRRRAKRIIPFVLLSRSIGVAGIVGRLIRLRQRPRPLCCPSYVARRPPAPFCETPTLRRLTQAP